MLPLLAASLGAVYAGGRLLDTARYWYDYKRNTGFSPRYPFLHGFGGMAGYASSGFNNLKRF